MSNDGRYMYHHNQGMQSHYDYSYPHQPYDTNAIQQQQQQPQHRPVRPPSTQSHSPTQPAHFNPPPSPYPQAYPTNMASYLTHAPPPAAWAGDNNWSSYTYPQQQQPTAPPEAFHSGPGRPETSNSTPDSPRNYISPPINPPGPTSRRDGRQTPASAPPLLNPSPPTQHKNKRRETNQSPPVPAASTSSPTGLDFRKLLDSYKLIIDANNNYSNGVGHSRAPPMDVATVERMLQAASYGAQMLDSASLVKQQQSVSPVVPSPKGKEPEVNSVKDSGNNSNPPSVKRQKGDKGDDSTQEGQTCLGCGATSTPEWRRGPMGPRTLCNACGLVYAKLIKKRVKETARAAKSNGQGGKVDDFASSAGDSDDDYGSKSSQ